MDVSRRVLNCLILPQENLESTLRHNYEIREEERVRTDAMRKEEHVRMAHNAIIISSDDESDSGRRQIPSKPVTSTNKGIYISD